MGWDDTAGCILNLLPHDPFSVSFDEDIYEEAQRDVASGSKTQLWVQQRGGGKFIRMNDNYSVTEINGYWFGKVTLTASIGLCDCKTLILTDF